MEKRGEKVVNHFHIFPPKEIIEFNFSKSTQQRRKSFLKIVTHRDLLSRELENSLERDGDSGSQRNEPLVETAFFNLIEEGFVTDVQYLSRRLPVPVGHLQGLQDQFCFCF